MAEYKDYENGPSQITELETLKGFVDWKGRPILKDKHGGKRATAFIFVMEGLENMAFVGNSVNLVTYIHGVMHYNLADSANMQTNYMGACYFLALFGGFISDSYVTRFKTNLIFASIELTGYILMTIQAHYPSLRPPKCNISDAISDCKHVTGGKAAMFYMGLYLMALGTGGLKAALPSLGADQFDEKDPQERRFMSSFFNWFALSINVGACIGVTCLVWIENNRGWDIGFGSCVGAVFAAIVSLVLGLPRYRNQIPQGSPLTRIAQVLIASFRNRNLPLPDDERELYEVHGREATLQTEFLRNTNQFRYLDKAAIVVPLKNPNMDDQKGGSTWRLCTVTQVEETKIIRRMIPLFASTIIMNTIMAQLQTFTVQQGATMDTHVAGGFHIPPASLFIIPVLFVMLLIPLYDQIFVPYARRITGHESGITHLQRVGVGLVLSSVSMAIAALVEVKRKAVATHHGMLNSSDDKALPISVFWLGFQYFVFGIGELFTFVGLMEFFYSEASSGMKSLSTAFFWCSPAFGFFLSSVLVNTVNAATRNITDSRGWLHGNNLNDNHLNLFYWMLSILSLINFFIYLFCANRYVYKQRSLDDTDITPRSTLTNVEEQLVTPLQQL
eukprot:Gb_24461 [translate_table: standard]